MKIILLTFGGGYQKYHDALQRIHNQALEYELFDQIITYTENDLMKLYPDFWIQHKDFILKYRRGFGYWIWKSFICLKVLESLDENDILFYLDCGCELNVLGKKRFLEYIDLVKEYKRLYFHLENIHTDLVWNKMDVIKEFDLKDNDILNLPQCVGGIQFYLKNDENIKLLNSYYQYCCNYHFIDDSPSIEPNYSSFKEHRHDQSILSLIVKKNNYFRIPDETWPPNMLGDKSQYPIWAVRNYSLESKLNNFN